MSITYSIIIPAYNVEGYLEHCLESIIAQTYTNFEVILVDDGSTDNTPKIADDYALKDKRVKVIHKENEGVSMARNTGIEIAKGRYFLFFDGDDFVEPICLEELHKLSLEKEVTTIIYGYYRYDSGSIKESCYPIFEKNMYQGKEILTDLISRFVGISNDAINGWLHHKKDALYVENPALWRIMVDGDIIRNNKIIFNKNLKVGEDTIFISEYLSCVEKCYVQQKCYYYLVTRETSTIYIYERNPIGKLEGKIKLIDARKELTEKINKNCGYNIASFWHGTVIMSCIEIAFLMGRKNENYGFLKRYKLFCSYLKIEEVKKIVKVFKPNLAGGSKLLPLLLLKSKLYFLLFICASILQLIHYEFKRS
jgi:glycosyltransferase involved in cell wall biosynthesis